MNKPHFAQIASSLVTATQVLSHYCDYTIYGNGNFQKQIASDFIDEIEAELKKLKGNM